MADAPLTPLKDHEIATLVNQLRDIAIEFHGAQQLRERIAHLVVPALKRAPPTAERSVTVELDVRHYAVLMEYATLRDVTPANLLKMALRLYQAYDGEAPKFDKSDFLPPEMRAPSPPVAAPSQLNQDLDDLATLVRRLARHLRKVAPDADLANQAVDYLERKGFNASPLRSEPAPQPPRPGTAPLSDEQIEAAKKKPSGQQTPFDAGCEVLDYLRANGASYYYTSRMLHCLHGIGHPTTPTPKD